MDKKSIRLANVGKGPFVSNLIKIRTGNKGSVPPMLVSFPQLAVE
jgi:hypothetical protein